MGDKLRPLDRLRVMGGGVDVGADPALCGGGGYEDVPHGEPRVETDSVEAICFGYLMMRGKVLAFSFRKKRAPYL